jgi:YHS domain-containing protein
VKNRGSAILIVFAVWLLTLTLPSVQNSFSGDTSIASVLSQPPPGDVGQKTVCAYCGMRLTVNKATPGATYGGKDYYFCDDMERDAFVKDPNKFLLAAARRASHSPSAALSHQ